MENASDSQARARLLAATTKESGCWLNALPISSVGLRMDDDVVRIAVGLRLGASLCLPHPCHLCGASVNKLAIHGLSCRKSQGRHPRHTSINELIQRSLTTAGVPSHLEPSGICRSDGKRPTVLPSSHGNMDEPWCGMPPAPTPLHHHTFCWPPVKPERLQRRQKRERSRSMRSSPQATTSCRGNRNFWCFRSRGSIFPQGNGKTSSHEDRRTIVPSVSSPEDLCCHPEKQCSCCFGDM